MDETKIDYIPTSTIPMTQSEAYSIVRNKSKSTADTITMEQNEAYQSTADAITTEQNEAYSGTVVATEANVDGTYEEVNYCLYGEV